MKNKVKSSILAGVSCLCLLLPSWKNTDLKDLSKPYLGGYECTQAHLGTIDCLGRFAEIRLELKDEENFLLYYKEKGGERKKVEGKYRYDKARQVLIVADPKGGIQREFPLVNGKLTVSLPVGHKMLVMQFERQ